MDISLEEKYILEYIKDTLTSFKIKSEEVNDAKYHHNTSYQNTPMILKRGILSMLNLNKLGIKKYSEQFLKTMSDTDSHINGIDAVSLSIVGLKDLDPKKFEYDPFNPLNVDLLVSSDIKARRATTHYDNEFLCFDSITNDKIKSVDIRLLKLIDENKDSGSITNIAEKYNLLRKIAMNIKDLNLDMSLRDMSNENLTMDIDKVSKAPKLILK